MLVKKRLFCPYWLLTTTWTISFFVSFLHSRLRRALQDWRRNDSNSMPSWHHGPLTSGKPKVHSFLSQLCFVISREKSCWAKEFIFFPFKIYAFRTSWFHGNYHFLLSSEWRWQRYKQSSGLEHQICCLSTVTLEENYHNSELQDLPF